MANPSPAQLAAREKFKAMVQGKSKTTITAVPNSMNPNMVPPKTGGMHTKHSSTNMTGSTKMMPGKPC